MILYIILLILFLFILVLTTFFTMYFIIPSIKEDMRQDDPVIPKLTPPPTLPKLKNISPYEQMEFIQKVVRPVSFEEKKRLLNGEHFNSEDFEDALKSEGNPNIEKQDEKASEKESENKSEKSSEKSSEKLKDKGRKDFKIWKFWYRIIKQIQF